jgi:hypothetical protein
MEKRLLEELKKFKTLSLYDTRLTLTENVQIILENGRFGAGAKEFRDIQSLSKTLGVVGKDFTAVFAELGLELKLSNTEIYTLLQMDAKELRAEFESALVKDYATLGKIKGSTVGNRLPQNAREVSKVAFLKELIELQKTKKGQVIPTSEIDALKNKVILDNASYSKTIQASKEFNADVKAFKEANPNLFKPKPKPKPEPPTPQETKIIDDILVKNPEVKTFNWKKLLGWTGAGVLTTAVLYGIYRAGHGGQDPPPIEDDDNDNDNNNTDNNNDDNTTSTKKTYTYCPETFPIEQFCKNETIRKVQKCLGGGLKDDSAFGPLTQAALVAKNLPGTVITQDTVKAVCGSDEDNKKAETTLIDKIK